MAFESQRISLIEHSCSSFCSFCFYLFVCMWGSSSFQWHWWGLSVGDADRWGLGSLLGLVGVCCTRRLTLFCGRVCASRERSILPQNSDLSFEASFGASPFVNSNTWHLICNYFNLNFIWYCMLICVVILYSRFTDNPPDMILGDNLSFLRWFYHNPCATAIGQGCPDGVWAHPRAATWGGTGSRC
jgi:hypothetical protein